MDLRRPLRSSKTGRTPSPASSAKDDLYSQAERAKKAFARLSGGRQLPRETKGRPLSAMERATVDKVVEELTGRKPRASLQSTQAEINRRLRQMFGGQTPRSVDRGAEPAPPPIDRPPASPRPPWRGGFRRT